MSHSSPLSLITIHGRVNDEAVRRLKGLFALPQSEKWTVIISGNQSLSCKSLTCSIIIFSLMADFVNVLDNFQQSKKKMSSRYNFNN